MAATMYVILRQRDHTGEGWEEAAHDVEAGSAEQAIRSYAAAVGADRAAGVYVAVPLRSWSPTTVKVETQTRIRFGEAT